MKRASNARKALIVLTDGADNRSRYTDSEVLRLARESDVRVYSIGLFGRVDFLDKIGKESGGTALWARQTSEVPAVVESLSRVFRNEYVLGYSPQNHSTDRKYRQVIVKFADTGARRVEAFVASRVLFRLVIHRPKPSARAVGKRRVFGNGMRETV